MQERQGFQIDIPIKDHVIPNHLSTEGMVYGMVGNEGYKRTLVHVPSLVLRDQSR